jgi:ABC-2 type transport system ATP-binding protein
LQIPTDGDFRSLKFLIARLDEDSVPVEELSLHTPDLDDVFLALTDKPGS